MPQMPAGVLSYTLMIAILSSTLLSAIVMTGYFYRVERISYEKAANLSESMESALQVALGDETAAYNERKLYQLFEDREDSMAMLKYPWGLWDVYDVTVYNSSGILSRIFSRGKGLSKKGRSALYLVDENRPVSVSGKTRLTGDCYIPKAGIQSAYINRVGYLNDRLVYGNTLESDDENPELNKGRLSVVTYFSKGQVNKYFPVREEYEEVFPLKHSFYNDTLMMFMGSTITLRDTLQGKIWVHAKKKIIVDSAACLDNVILSAPIVEIDTGVTARIQVIATDTILLRKDVKLKYPSNLMVLNDDPPAHIYLGIGAEVNGSILMHGDADEYFERVVKMEDDSQVNGMIYINGFIEIYGIINGHLTARKFLVQTFTSVYENYIFNAELDATGLNPAFLGSDLWFVSKENKVLQWLP